MKEEELWLTPFWGSTSTKRLVTHLTLFLILITLDQRTSKSSRIRSVINIHKSVTKLITLANLIIIYAGLVWVEGTRILEGQQLLQHVHATETLRLLVGVDDK